MDLSRRQKQKGLAAFSWRGLVTVGPIWQDSMMQPIEPPRFELGG
jgi:hypothetical protein